MIIIWLVAFTYMHNLQPVIIAEHSCANVFIVSTTKSLRDVVNSANEGDTIIVSPGVYKTGNIIIKQPLVIKGLDYPIIDGEYLHEIFTVTSSHVTIEGLKFIQTGKSSMEDKAAIKCLDAHHITIRNNILENTFFGIHLSNTNYARIECNLLHSSSQHEYELGNGIHLWKCKNALVQGNNISGHRDGIYLEFATNSIILDNFSNKNIRYGLHFMFSHDNSYMYNQFSNNGAGVAVMYTTNVSMMHNKFDNNWGSSSYGILLKDIRDSHVQYNEFYSNTTGIYMEGTSRINFKDNLFRNNGYAVKLMASCDDNTFSGNSFVLNTFDISTNGMAVYNNIDGNYWDKYQGYDLDRDGVGDIPYHPISLYSMIVEQVPSAVMLWRSFLVFLLDKAEKAIPLVTPENLKDNKPQMKRDDFNRQTNKTL